jgi:hypothetical protein
MALQDLTPQLRTRLGRVERMVGVFVGVATLLLVAGFAYYVYHTAQRKGWFLAKVKYQTGVNNAAGLTVGSPVMLMGFNAGKITKITPNNPWDFYGVTVDFEIMQPNFGYIWTDSKVKIVSGILGDRVLEISKGREDWAVPTVIGDNRTTFRSLSKPALDALRSEITNRLFTAELAKPGVTAISADRRDVLIQQTRYNLQAEAQSKQSETNGLYVPWNEAGVFWLDPIEARPVGERVEEIADTVEKALPNFLALTNQLTAILNNAASATAKLDGLLSDVRPAALNLTKATEELPRLAQNFAQISENLTNGQGSLGDWILTDDLKTQIDQTFGGVQVVMGTANTNLVTLNQSLENLSQITANLATQVHANTNLLSGVYHLVIDADQMVQGLKQHWFLRGAFK